VRRVRAGPRTTCPSLPGRRRHAPRRGDRRDNEAGRSCRAPPGRRRHTRRAGCLRNNEGGAGRAAAAARVPLGRRCCPRNNRRPTEPLPIVLPLLPVGAQPTTIAGGPDPRASAVTCCLDDNKVARRPGRTPPPRTRPVCPPPRTQESRRSRAGFPKLSHPQGVRLDGHLLRGGAATRTVDHCTSPPFVRGQPYRIAPAGGKRAGAHRSIMPRAPEARPQRPVR
jgi:hypothetical protein